MADDNAIVWSIGFMEGFINSSEKLGAENSDAARTHLKIIEDAFHEYRRTVTLQRQLLALIKTKVDTAAAL